MKLTEEQKILVQDNIKLVHFVIQKYLHIHPSNPDYEEYVQTGSEALCKVASRFNPELGIKFSTYATTSIYGYLMQFRRNYFSTGTRTDLDNLHKVLQFCEENKESDMMHLTNEDLSAIGINSYEYSEALLSYGSSRFVSIDEDIGNSDNFEGETSLHNLLVCSEDFEDNIATEMKLLKSLESIKKERDRDIVKEFVYSKLYGVPTNQKQLAEKYGLTQSVVSRIIIKWKNSFETMK